MTHKSSTLHKFVIAMLVVVPLIGVLAAIYLLWNRYVFWTDIALLVSLYSITVLGITVGYHRMLTHEGFHAPAFVRALLLIAGCMAFEGAPLQWAATHIRHHAHSDEEGDPHSPLEGFWHAHFGWLFDLSNFDDPAVYAPHLLKDPVVVFVSKTRVVWILVSLLIPALLGGWTGFIWGGPVRIFLVNHVTWSINSVCHTFGKRAFTTTDESRNHWIMGLLAFGEGWHNNHHAFPRSAFHGLRWWQIDFSGMLIAFCEKIGLVWNVQRVSNEVMEMKKKTGEGLEEVIADLRLQLSIKIAAAREELLSMRNRVMSIQLPHPEMETLVHMHEGALQRLDEINTFVQKANTMKKQRIAQYVQEIQRMTEQVKASLPQALSS